MPDTLTVEETRRLIKKLRGRVFLAGLTDDLLRLCDGLDIAQEMAEELRMAASAFSHREKGWCNHCSYAEALAKWDKWQGSK